MYVTFTGFHRCFTDEIEYNKEDRQKIKDDYITRARYPIQEAHGIFIRSLGPDHQTQRRQHVLTSSSKWHPSAGEGGLDYVHDVQHLKPAFPIQVRVGERIGDERVAVDEKRFSGSE